MCRKNWGAMFLAVFMVGGMVGPAWSQITMQFPVNRDVGINAKNSNNEQLSAVGVGQWRGMKANQHNSLFDFDTDAVATFLTANPGPASWTFNIYPTAGGVSQDIGIETVESANDWAESDATFNFGVFNWTQGTAAATYYYAQTFYLENPTTGVKFVDTVNSLPWIDNGASPGTGTGGEYTFTTRNPQNVLLTSGNPNANFVNSTMFAAADITAASGSTFATVNVDSGLIDELINNGDNRGIRFFTTANEWGNFEVLSREDGFAAFLEVTVVPEPSSLVLLGLGLSVALRRRRFQK